MKKLSYADLQAKCDRESVVAHVMTIAAIEQADAKFIYRDGRDSYKWSVYRLTGAAGGYLVGIYDGFANKSYSLFYCERLDTAIAGIRERGYAYADAGGICQAVEKFQNARFNMLRAA